MDMPPEDFGSLVIDYIDRLQNYMDDAAPACSRVQHPLQHDVGR